MNQIRGILLEHGVAVHQGVGSICKALPTLLAEERWSALGLVSTHTGTGGKIRLEGISKRGDRYLGQLLIHGARAVVAQAGDKQDRLSRWLRSLVARRGMNKAMVALANKNARVAFAPIQGDQPYDVTKMFHAA